MKKGKSIEVIDSPVKIPNQFTKHYYTDYFPADKIHPDIQCLQSKSFNYVENYFSVHRNEILNIIRNL